MSSDFSPAWSNTSIGASAYLKGRIGWQGLRASEFIDEGPFLITGTDFVEGKIDWKKCYHVSEGRFQEAAYIHVKDSDLLVTKDGTIGKVAYVTDCPEKTVLNSGIFLVRCKDGSFEHRYLYQVLNSDFFAKFLRRHLAGSTINHLYQHVFIKFEFSIPDQDIQVRIAEALGAFDSAIETTSNLVKKYQWIKDGLMHDLFTRGVTEDGKVRPPRDQAPNLYKDTPIGWLPKDWDTKNLGDLLAPLPNALRSGPFGSALLKSQLVEDGCPLLGIDNVYREAFVDAYNRFVPQNLFLELARYKVRPKDIVITIMGTVGRCCVLPDDIGNALSSKHIWTVTLDQTQISPELVCWQLNYASWVLSWFRREGQGAVMDAIQSGTLKNLLLPIPTPNRARKNSRKIQ